MAGIVGLTVILLFVASRYKLPSTFVVDCRQ